MKRKSILLIIPIVLGLAAVGLGVYHHQQSNQTETIAIGPDINMDFVLIHPGTFTMGSPVGPSDGDETPEHKVMITKPFYLGKYEVTQEQWEALMGSNPSKFKGAKLPVDSVSWEDAQAFLVKLQEKTGRTFQLPTEAHWEYAARAGTTTKWDFGNDESILADYTWFEDNADGMTHPVGQKKPNTWGLYDMYGNIQEWCRDWYATYTKEKVSDPQGPSSGQSRILRGGAWGDGAVMVRSAYRNTSGADNRTPGNGFRVELVID